MRESDLGRLIQLEYSHGDTRLWRRQVGLFWAGRVIKRSGDTITLASARAVQVGQPGESDYFGVTRDPATGLGVHLSLELKLPEHRTHARGGATQEQLDYLTLVTALGGRAGLAYTVGDAGRIIHGG